MPAAFAFALLVAAAPAPRDRADTVRAEPDIRQTALRHARDVQRCYVDVGLRRNAALDGVVEVELTVLPTGIVQEVRVSSATVRGDGARETAECIATVARNWRFVRGPFDVESIVFPFVLRKDPVRPAARRGA